MRCSNLTLEKSHVVFHPFIHPFIKSPRAEHPRRGPAVTHRSHRPVGTFPTSFRARHPSFVLTLNFSIQPSLFRRDQTHGFHSNVRRHPGAPLPALVPNPHNKASDLQGPSPSWFVPAGRMNNRPAQRCRCHSKTQLSFHLETLKKKLVGQC